MLSPIPFSVPSTFAVGIANGNLIRFGAIIKDAASGQIVAHMQETGLVNQLVGSAISSPFSPISTVSSLGSNVQLAAVQRMLGAVQMLQMANLGATLVGIGVNAAGFKAVMTRLDGLHKQLSGVSGEINRQFQVLEARGIREHQSQVKSLLDRADTTYALSNASTNAMLIDIAQALSDESWYFRGEIEHILGLPTFERETFCLLLQHYTLCDAVRAKCLVLAEELPAAKEVSESASSHYNQLLDGLTPLSLAKKSACLVGQNGRSLDHLLRQEIEGVERTEMGGIIGTKSLMVCIRDAQDAASTRPLLIDTLIEKGISGKDFLRQLYDEKSEPILCLNA